MGGSIFGQPQHASAAAWWAPFAGMPDMVMLCSAPEWQASVGDQLRHWGINVQMIADPAEMHVTAVPLLIFGNPRDWTFADEDIACEKASWTIDATEDGPRAVVTKGKRSMVSCYSLDGLYKAIAHAFAPDGAVDAVMESEAAAEAMPAGRHARILVVEDHEVNLALIRDQFDTLGYQADLTNDGSDALTLFEKNAYDMVFTDLSMPGMDGYTLATFLRRRGAQLPIIAITAHASVEEHSRCKQVGISDVLLKPMSLDDIDQMVRKYMKGSVRPVSLSALDQKKPVLSEDLLQTLRASSAKSIAVIHRALATGDIKEVQEQLHSIKGAFSMIREQTVVAACVRLEHLARAVNLPELTGSLPKFEALMNEVLAGLKREEI
ncbi:response regulator [Collimonas humicola]|uniref:Hpt domain-containing response regulator n=1 Tax=Collimonas humicola TaxID=2825886 RepID=UPI001B8B57F0|nr:response regulator [Collimonas humicola]